MKSLISATLSMILLLTPFSAFAGTRYLYLENNLESKPADYSSGTIISSAYITIQTDQPNPTIMAAVKTVLNQAQLMPIDDAATIVLAALKAADEDQTSYYENVMGFSDAYIRSWVQDAIPRGMSQKMAAAIQEKIDGVKKMAITAVGLTIGLVGGALLIPLAFTGVGLIPALMIASLGSAVMEGAVGMIKAVNSENKVVLQANMYPVMKALLGAQQAEPGSKVSWTSLSFVPVEELVTRIKRSTLERQAIAHLNGKKMQELTKAQAKNMTTAQNLYAKDLLLSEILLSVMSRQLAGVALSQNSMTQAFSNRGTSFFSGLMFKLSDSELVSLAIANEALDQNADIFLGLPGVRGPEGEAIRMKEIKYLTTLVKAGILVLGSNKVESAEKLESLIAKELGPDASFEKFDANRANQSLMKIGAQKTTNSGMMDFILRGLKP